MDTGQLVKQSGKWAAVAMGGLVLLVLLAFAALQTPLAKRFAVQKAVEALAGVGVKAEVSTPEGIVPFRLRIAAIRFSDREGEWLNARDTAVAVDPFLLARGRVSAAVEIAEANVLRLPEPAAASASHPLSFLDGLSPIPVEGDVRMGVKVLRLGEPLAGRELAGNVRLDVSARDGALYSHLGVDLARKGGGGAAIAASASLDPGTRFASIDLSVQEAPGGLMARLAGLEAEKVKDLPVAVSVKGEGPFSAFKASLDARAGETPMLSGTLEASLGNTSADDSRFALTAEADPAFLPLDPELTKALGNPVRLSASGVVSSAGLPAPQWKLHIEELAVTAATATATVKGDSGPMARSPRLVYAVSAKDPAALGVKAGPLAAQGTLEADLDPDHPLAARLTLRSADLGSALSPLGVGLSGSAEVEATVKGDQGGQAYEATLDATLTGITPFRDGGAPGQAPLGPKLAAVLGREAELKVGARFMAGNKAQVRELVFTSAGLRATASGSLDLDARTGEVTLQAGSDDLATLAPLAGVKLAGSADLAVEVGGSFDAPAVTVSLLAKPLAVETVRLDRASLTLAARPDKGGLSGRFQAEAARDSGRLNASSSFALAGDRLALSGLKATGPGLDLSGDLAASLDNQTASGQLKCSADLAALGAFLGRKMQGKARLEARLASDGPRQDVAARLEASGLSAEGVRAGKADLDASVQDVLRAPRGDLAATLSQAGAGDAKVDALTFKAKGSGKDISFELSAKGDYQGRLEASAGGSFAPARGGGTLKLARLTGNARGVAVKLDRPATAVIEGGGLKLDGLALSMDKATLTASGELRPSKVDFSAQLASFPLAMLEKFGQRPLEGTAQASARLTGSMAAPRAAVGLKLDGVKDRALAGRKVPAVSLKADAEIAGGRLSASATGSAGPEASFQARAAFPARLSLAPSVFEVPPGGELDAALSGAVNLAHADSLVGDESLQLKGILKADFTARGRLSAPAVSGKASLEGGEAVYLSSGTRLRDISMEVTATGGELALTRFNAKGMRGGTVSATGKAAISPESGFPFEGSLVMDKLNPVRTEELTAALSARLEASGSAKGAKVKGAASIGPVEVNLPERLPPEATPIKVQKVNVPAQPGGRREAAVPSLPAPPFPVELDLVLDVPGRMFVRGMGLDSVWAGNLHVKGTMAEPVIDGAVRVVKGRLDFFGRNFTLERGVVTFVGSNPPAPILDIEAQTQAGDLTASILATGPVAKPKIELASDPPLPRDEILARVLFGKGVTTLTPPQALQLAQAVASLTGAGGSLDFLGKTRKLTGLDYLGLKSSGQEMSQSSLAAGKYIADGVYVEASQALGSSGSSVSVEVDVTKNITVESKVGLDAKTGIGVNWKFDY